MDGSRAIDGSFEAPADIGAARRRTRAEVEARCRGATGSGGGAVVTITAGSPRGLQPVVTDGTACVVSDLALWRWDDEELAALAGQLGPGSSLVFLEPTAALGWRRLVHRLGRRLWRLGLRHDFERDVPDALRAAGLLVGSVDRFGIGPAEIRSYAWGVAEPFPRSEPE